MERLFNAIKKDPARQKILKEQLLIILAAIILSAVSFQRSGNSSILTDGNTILRGNPGDADEEYELVVGGLSDSYEHISVRVSNREYSEEEAFQQFDALMEELAVHIVGNNEDLGGIDTDLVLPKEIDGFEDIRLSWLPDNTDLISRDGSVNNLELEEEVDTFLNVTLSTGPYSSGYIMPVTVVPASYPSTDELLAELSAMIEQADKDQVSDTALVLPDSVCGFELEYSEKSDSSWIQILSAGIIAAVLIGLKPEQDRRNTARARETELLMDYSEVVSKLMVYMGAGLNARNAWTRVSADYSSALAAGQTGRRAVYEEMLITAGEFDRGISEAKALNDFARRCSQKCYLKLVSLLEQNTRTGDHRIEAAMQLEIQEAFEQRRNIAKRLGEEAGTKLMAPLVLSLITIFVIVGVPALLTLS